MISFSQNRCFPSIPFFTTFFSFLKMAVITHFPDLSVKNKHNIIKLKKKNYWLKVRQRERERVG